MRKYAMKITKYSEAGGPTNDIRYEYADDPQALADAKLGYEKQRYSKIEEDGSVKTGFKMYKVDVMQAEYTKIDDFDAFCSTNKVLV